MEAVLARLDRLEAENTRLRTELEKLQARLGIGSEPPLEERVAVTEQRVEEQAQAKVESSQRAIVRLKGMLLFNAFSSGRNGVPADFPTIATAARNSSQIRATMRQSSVGIAVESPFPIAGAHARGELMADFFGEFEDYNTPRIRTGFLELQWPSTAVTVGIEKPIVAPRNPSSLAQFLYPALWGAGNLWLWQPQIRIEQKFNLAGSEVKLQAGLLQTNDQRALPGNSSIVLQPRPAWQGRLAFARRFGEDRAFEVAPGFHSSRSLLQGTSVLSQLITTDWRIAPASQWELTGAMFTGRNAGPIGGVRQGIAFVRPGVPQAVRTFGGWNQLMYRPVERLRLHAILGQQDDNDNDAGRGSLSRNVSWMLNGILQLGPNVLVGLEAQQIRSSYVGLPTRVLNRYDVSLGYLF